jgi:putative transposase
VWVPHDVRDLVVDFVRYWSEKTEIGAGRFIHWLGVRASKFYDWRERYGRVNEHNGWIPRDFWLQPWEKQSIIRYYLDHPLEGYRRLTFMMLDADVVAVSPSSVWRFCNTQGCSPDGRVSRRAKEPVSSSPHSRTSIGISMFPTST